MRSPPSGVAAWYAYLIEYPVMSFVQMYPRVGPLPIAAVRAAMGLRGAASPRPPRPAPPRPRPAAAPRPAPAGGIGPAPAGAPAAARAGAAAGAAGVSAAMIGLRSSSVDHRVMRTLTGLPESLTFA